MAEIKKQKCEKCDRSPQRLKFLNINTGELVRINCKAYCCPYCGKRKAYRLQIALENYLAQFKHLRLWTFTISSRFFTTGSPQERQKAHARIFQNAWQRFWRDWRRNKMVSQPQRQVGYISVVEFHQSGFTHRHCLMTEFLPIETVRFLWRLSVSRALQEANIWHAGYTSQCNVVGALTAKNAARYVSKYVLKSAQTANVIQLKKRWSRSSREALFPAKNEGGEWCVVRFTVMDNMKILRRAENLGTDDALNLSPISTTTQKESSMTLFLEAELIPPTGFHPSDTKTEPPYNIVGAFEWIWESFGE